MNSQLTVLSDEQVTQVSGGHGSLTWLIVMEIPHAIMGIIELINYIGERYTNGCDNIDEHDYVGKGMCAITKPVRGLF